MWCSACTTVLRLCSARSRARHTQVDRVYACPSCGNTVYTEERITKVRSAPVSPPGTQARQVPKRQQFIDDSQVDQVLPPVDPVLYKGE